MCEVVVLTKEKMEEVVRQAVVFALVDFRNGIENIRTGEIMTKKECAYYLRCDTAKIDRLRKEGLPFIKFGEHPRFRKSDINAWLNSL